MRLRVHCRVKFTDISPRLRMEAASNIHSSHLPHPRACGTCSRAKVKCVFASNETNICQRCHRLQKSCEPVPIRVRTKRKVPHDSKYRVEKLEAKLDGLVTLLKSSQQNGLAQMAAAELESSRSVSLEQSSESTTGSELGRSGFLNGQHGPSIEPQIHIISPSINQPAIDLGWGPRHPSNTPPSSEVPFGITGGEDPDELLRIFRTEMNHWLPFISLPGEISAMDLYSTRPFLWLTIMGVTSRYSTRQAEFGKLIMEQLSKKMFVNGERTMDMLQGVLIYTAWSMGHFYNVIWYTNMISTASTLVGDLRINKNPLVETPNSIMQLFRSTCVGVVPTQFMQSNSPRTLEERRAYLGYYLLYSVVYLLFQRLEPPRWTSYGEECCQLLSESGASADKYAVALIRLQLIHEKVPLSLWHSSPDPLSPFPAAVSFSQTLEGQLRDLKRSLDPEVANKVNFQLSCHAVETAIFRIGLSMPTEGSKFDVLGSQRPHLLYSCLQAVKNFADTFLAIPVAEYRGLPMTFYAQITHTMGTLHLLHTFVHPDWNLATVRELLDFPDVFRKLAERFYRAKLVLGIDPDRIDRLDEFSKSATKFEFLIVRWVERFNPQTPQYNQPITAEGVALSVNRDLETAYPMEHFDDDWIRDMFGTWDYQSNTGAVSF